MQDFKTILFATDFSPSSERAMDYALVLAQAYDAEVHLLHAIVLHESDPGNPEKQFPESMELLSRMSEVAESELARAADRHQSTCVSLKEVTRRGYSAGEVIIEYADEITADLIIVGTHGRRGIGRWVLGSVAEEVVRHASCPVLSVRDMETEGVPTLGRILVPVDFSRWSAHGVKSATELAARFDAGLELVHVIEEPVWPEFYPVDCRWQLTEELQRAATTELEALASDARALGVDVELRILNGQPAMEISHLVEELGVGLVVLPTSGRSGIEHMLLGSTAERVVRRAACPVLTLPISAGAQSEGKRATG